MGGFGEKSPSKDMKKFFFQLSNLSQPVFYLKTQPIGAGLGNCSVPNFCETSFRYFCSLFTGT